jgi:hypothetical protein
MTSATFLTNGSIDWASSRYRGYWIADCRPDWQAVQLKGQVSLPDTDNYVIIKDAPLKLVEQLKGMNKRIYWDVCDPVHWFSPNEAADMALLVDGIVASNEGLAQDIKDWSGAATECIPDRLDLEHYDRQRIHSEVEPLRYIWFGSAQNRASLYGGFVTLERLKAAGYKVELTIMDDRPDMPLYYGPSCPVYMKRWTLRDEVEVLANHDIALLPKYPGAWGRVKSNNKKLSAWACGLPVDDASDYRKSLDLASVVDFRHNDSQYGLDWVHDKYDIEQSAVEWEYIFS